MAPVKSIIVGFHLIAMVGHRLSIYFELHQSLLTETDEKSLDGFPELSTSS
jgi:hypothetical protein